MLNNKKYASTGKGIDNSVKIMAFFLKIILNVMVKYHLTKAKSELAIQLKLEITVNLKLSHKNTSVVI